MNEVKDSVEFYRNLWAGAEARLAESQAEVAGLKSSEREEKVRELAVRAVRAEAEVARLRAALVTAHGALVSAEAALSRAQLSFADRFEEFGAGVAARAVESALEPTR